MNQVLSRRLTVIIASIDDGKRIGDCLDGLRGWFPRIIMVGNRKPRSAVDEIEWIHCNSTDSSYLWERGLEESRTPWNLLILSQEVVTGKLKRVVEEHIKSDNASAIFLPSRKIIFLRKVLKYPLMWPGEFPSCLLYASDPRDITLDSPIPQKPMAGELIRLAEETLGEAFVRTLGLSEARAERLYRDCPNLTKSQLAGKAVIRICGSFVESFFRKKGFKEGFEGLTLALLDGVAHMGACLRYYEKFVRGGRVIADRLPQMRKILVIKAISIGDMVLATPVFRNIKKLLPGVSLSVLGVDPADSLLEGNPYIDCVYAIPHRDANGEEQKRRHSTLATLNTQDFDLLINLHARNWSNKIVRKIKARWKINSSYFYRDKETDVLVGCGNLIRSIVERDLDCLRSIGLKPLDKHTELFLKPEEIDWGKTFFSRNGLSADRGTVFVHPFSTTKTREWGGENFAEICRRLTCEHGLQVIVNCSSKELPRTEMLRKVAPSIVVFSGSLRELMALLRASTLFIGNDSGPSHMSVALDVPTIVLQGALAGVLMRDTDLYAEKHFVFDKPLPCRDALLTQCLDATDPETGLATCHERTCLSFTVDEVMKKILEFVARSRGEGKEIPGLSQSSSARF